MCWGHKLLCTSVGFLFPGHMPPGRHIGGGNPLGSLTPCSNFHFHREKDTLSSLQKREGRRAAWPREESLWKGKVSSLGDGGTFKSQKGYKGTVNVVKLQWFLKMYLFANLYACVEVCMCIHWVCLHAGICVHVCACVHVCVCVCLLSQVTL